MKCLKLNSPSYLQKMTFAFVILLYSMSQNSFIVHKRLAIVSYTVSQKKACFSKRLPHIVVFTSPLPPPPPMVHVGEYSVKIDAGFIAFFLNVPNSLNTLYVCKFPCIQPHLLFFTWNGHVSVDISM